MNNIIIIIIDIIIVVISCFISFFIGIKCNYNKKLYNKVEFYLVRISKHKYYLYLGKPQIKFEKARQICITPNKGKFITDNPYKYGIITSNYDYLEYFTPVKVFLNLED